ncbi:DNA-binding protein [Paenibacillus segetis]|uniref:DNA-binding protein n=1 Tax=Paenibacillus segetis TaxID=1325360 RepID=A0ABQ1YRI3_9BACL|nr:DNA-binding protein [Paenibacillus segetis]GGH34868.1 hypothetical protein GCM10008013_40850 [Paenibacillus segetis]
MNLDLEDIHVDSLTDILKASFSLENWEGMLLVADRLYKAISDLYETKQLERANNNTFTSLNLKNSIVYYFGFSLCSKGIALQKQGRYSESRACIQQYSDLSWINGLDDEGWVEVEYYRNIAIANRYVIDLTEGKTYVLQDYVAFIRNNREELLPGLITILESAITFDYSIDSVVAEFGEIIDSMCEFYKTKAKIRYYVDYKYLLARYYHKQDRNEIAIHTILKSLQTSSNLKDDTGIIKSVALFEFLRNHANNTQHQVYKNIMKNILEGGVNDEKGILIDGIPSVS